MIVRKVKDFLLNFDDRIFDIGVDLDVVGTCHSWLMWTQWWIWGQDLTLGLFMFCFSGD